MNPARDHLLRRLADRIRTLEAERPHFATTVSLGLPALEDTLPDRRLPAGSLVELLAAAPGAGAWTLALVMARHACGRHKSLMIADVERRFYPPGAARLGIDLERTLVIRPKLRHKALSAVAQSLRCAAIGAVIVPFEHLPTTDFRRLQLAAENGGGIGFLVRPMTALCTPSFAAVRLAVSPAPLPDREAAVRRLRVEIVRLRGGKSGQSFFLEIDDETSHVSVPASLAVATPVARKRLGGTP
jgi:hypothetical protein